MANKRLNDLPEETDPAADDFIAVDGATTRKSKRSSVLGANLEAFRALTSAADKGLQFTGTGTASTFDLTAAGKALLDDADAAAQRTTLGLVIGTNVQGYTAALAAVTGTNTGDQTITLTGDVTGSGTGSFAASIGSTKVTSAMLNADVFSTAHSWGGTQTFTAPVLGTPASGVATNLTGTASGLTAGHVTTNANLTGDVTSVGNASTIGATKVTSAMLNADVYSSTHTWSAVQTFSAAPIVPTQSPSDNSTKAASTAYVDAQVSGSVSGVSSLNGQTGALVLLSQPQGRITTASGVAVQTANALAATTVYYTISNGNMCPINDGTRFVPTVFTQLSQLTTDTTKSPAACTTNSNYDMFVWNDSGTVRCTRGPAYTTSTPGSASRGTGAGTTELDLTTTFPTNKNAITNGPAANRGTYVGTIRTNGSSQVDVSFGGSASGGTAGSLNIWNMYNRSLAAVVSIDTGAGYNYGASGSSIARQARASAGNQVGALQGLQQDAVFVNYSTRIDTAAVSGAFGYIGIGRNTTTAYSTQRVFSRSVAAVIMISSPYLSITEVPPLGFTNYVAIEAGDNTNNSSFNADANGTIALSVWF